LFSTAAAGTRGDGKDVVFIGFLSRFAVYLSVF